MTELLLAAGGFVGGVCGFFAGLRYAARHLPAILANTGPDQLRQIGRQTAELRRQKAAV